jgi:hypothetical protein
MALGVAISPIFKGVARLASEEAAAVCVVRLGGGLSPPGSAARRFAADSEQRRAALRAVALPPGPTVRQGHLARVGDGDLLAADAPALWAGVLCLVGVRLNHMRQSIFRGYVPLMRGAPSMG